MGYNNPLNSLTSDIRSACVSACLPVTGSIKDWSQSNKTVTAQGSPYWQDADGRLGINCFDSGDLLLIASSTVTNFNAGTIFLAGNLEYTRQYSRMIVTSASPMHIEWVMQGTGAISLNGSGFSGWIWEGTKSAAATFQDGSAAAFYKNGVYAGVGGSTLTCTAGSYPISFGNRNIVTNTASRQPVFCYMVFNRILTPAEISTLHTWAEGLKSPVKGWPGYGVGKVDRSTMEPVSRDGLVGWWDLGLASGGKVPDLS